jgi:hypothetical protein
MHQTYFQRIICTAILALSTSFVSAQWTKNSEYRGDKLISDAKFMKEVNRTCSDNTGLKSCAIVKLKVDNHTLFEEMNNHAVVPLFDNGDLSLKLIKKQSEDSEYAYDVLLVTYWKKEKVDSLSCYSYSNIPENSVANETIYYISEDFQVWTLSLEYEEESTTASDWRKRKINPQTGKISE